MSRIEGRAGRTTAADAKHLLVQLGMTQLGSGQLMSGQPLTSASDRAVVAKLLPALVLATPRTRLMEIYDFPGDYAQRFDGIDK